MEPHEELSLLTKLVKSHKQLVNSYKSLLESHDTCLKQIEYLNHTLNILTMTVDDHQQRIKDLEYAEAVRIEKS